MSDEIKDKVLLNMPPLVKQPNLIQVKTIKRKYVDQIRGYSQDEFEAILTEDYDSLVGVRITDPHSTVRIIGKVGYTILFLYKRGEDPTTMLGTVPGTVLYSVYREARVKVSGIEWPLNDETRKEVEKIEKQTWEEMERIPQIFED